MPEKSDAPVASAVIASAQIPQVARGPAASASSPERSAPSGALPMKPSA